MATRLLFCVALLAGCGLADALRGDRAKVTTLQQQFEEEVKTDSRALVAVEGQTLTQLLTTAVGIITSMVSSFSETPPDYEYAFDSLNTQGWKMVKIIVPAESQKDRKFRNVRKAWGEAFSDAAELAEDITNGVSNGDMMLLSNAVLETVSKALKTCSAVFPDNMKYFDAFDKLVGGVGGSMVDFSKAMGWMDASSLVQVEGDAQEKPDFSQLLTTGVGIITSLISSFSEDPPDYEHAIDSLNIQGWKMVKLMVPKAEHRSRKMKNARKAWDRVMGEANDILEDTLEAYKGGYMGKIIDVLLNIIDTALNTAADILTDKETSLRALAEFIKGFGGSVLEFSVALGWIVEY